MFFIIDCSLICIIMLSAVFMTIRVAGFFGGLAAAIFTILFAAQAIAGIYFTAKKSEYRRMYLLKSSTAVFMTAVSSVLCLVTTYLFLRDVSVSFGSYISNVPTFLSAALFICCPCLCAIVFWISASGFEDEVNYFEFVKQLVSSAVLIFALCVL